jgi:lipid II:glycine glycyltransferase (peptidoglycan interpeptide bridge formation enzyme)
MLVLQTSHGIPIRKYYFTHPTQPGWRDLLIPTAYMDCYSGQKPRFFQVENRHTLLTDLTLSEENLFASFPKDTRSQIRRSEQAGLFTPNFQVDEAQFIALFNRFAQGRGLSPLSAHELQQVGKENCLLLSMDKDGQATICHYYLLSRELGIASLLISASDTQYNGDADMRKAIGHANRALHWQGMCHLKHLGFHTYDWCGYVPQSDDPVIQGINRFKRTFNGKLTPIYNYYSPIYAFIELLRRKRRKSVVQA